MLSQQALTSKLREVFFLDFELVLNHVHLIVQQVQGGLAAVNQQACAIFLWNLQASVDGIGNIPADTFPDVKMILG